MPTFSYDARDLQGNAVSGIIEADAPSGAAAALREQGLFPSRIEAVRNAPPAAAVVTPPRLPEIGPDGPLAPPESPSLLTPMAGYGAPSTVTATPPLTNGMPSFAPSAAGVPPPSGFDPFADTGALRVSLFPMFTGTQLPDLAVAYRQLATLLNAGVPMVQAVSTLAEQIRSGKLRGILRECATAVASGYPLSSVFKRYPNIFTPLQYELIRAGETGGMLDRMCNRLAGYIERDIEMRRKLKRETLPQKFTLGVAALVIPIVSWAFGGVPMLLTALGSEGSILATGVFVWWLGRFLYQFPAFAAVWDGFKLYLPGVGDVTRRYSTARFCRALGALYGGGVILSKAVEIAARACGNGAITQRLLKNAPALQFGEGLSGMLSRSGLLSPIAVQMARTGEQTGSLDAMMEKVADYLESEADVKAHQMSIGLGVALTVLGGIIVFFILLAGYGGYLHKAVDMSSQ